MRLSGKEVIAFVEISIAGSNRILAVQPIFKDGSASWGFNHYFADEEGKTVDVWGIKSRRGKRIAAAYRSGELDTVYTEAELNRVLRPDEFDRKEEK